MWVALAALLFIPALLPAPAGAAWFGPGARAVFLHPEQRRTGLDGADLFAGFAGGWERGRFALEAEVGEGGAVQHIRVDGAHDPRLRIWTLAAGVRVRPLARWPVTAAARAGVWRFDYRDERVTLAFPGLDPIDVRFDDFTPPAMTVEGGLTLAPWRRLRIDLGAGVLALRLGEARLDPEATVATHWRMSPTASIRLALGGPR